jgi:methylglutaconyl-CoA hydratase
MNKAMSTLRITEDGPVTRVWMSRPERRNAFDEAMVRELGEVFTAVADSTLAVVLGGDGPVFCAGADVGWMRRSVRFSEPENLRDARGLADALTAIDHCPCPVIGRVQGAALGGGAGLVACCDIVVAADDARLGFTEVRLGLVPAVISPFVLAKLGPGATRRYLLTGEQLDARAALSLGLVHEVVDPKHLDASVDQVCASILRGGPRAVRETKQLIRQIQSCARPQALDRAVETIARVRVSDEGQEGLAAFLEKRSPGWL